MAGSSPLLVYAFLAACIFGQLFELAQAQNQTATTDPAEGVPLSLSLSHAHSFVTYYSSWLIRAFMSSAYVTYEQQYETFLFVFWVIFQ